MISASGSRIGWADLPAKVCAAVEDIVGGEVCEAVSQPGGFSPGSADRVRTTNGRRAFVKAVSPAQNAESPDLHRREARITGTLPPTAPAPRLLGTFEHDGWVVLVLEDVEGRHPRTPWEIGELTAVLDALDDLARQATPTPLPELASTAAQLADDFDGWRRLAADTPDDLDAWAVDQLDDLQRWAARGLAALTGDTLVHLDVRADNLLLRPDGGVSIVDWPWAATGPRWLDALSVLVNVHLYGGVDVEAILAARDTTATADPGDLTGVLVGLTGFFLDYARRPSPPGLPTLRGFQRAQGESTLRWVRARMRE
ncbi:aminoglycoside phosphotransferase family protein [Planosporangium flavigriseum]|uniref:aminoglycoside phosphotransferase family protein n=1 Tax=Planosporangium flavigriseum TaxID=373681 RepID=UPI00143C6793|nr:aminoglycoside phosphotransferase family protein [Planosporangium flavigriseum]NJC63164.1 aminoglycoside phosphotransferase family protein [Planosporangium flavigriseum]